MDNHEGTGSVGGKGKRKQAYEQRKSWSVVEEEHLIAFLYELVDTGKKSDNGFRSGYHGTLVKLLSQKMPGSTFLLKHIRSKMTQWKRDYALIENMLGYSGFGWNDADKTIEVPNDVWEEYARSNKDARGKRYKQWPYYDHWCQLFGKDRANGHGTEDVIEMIENILVPKPIPDDLFHDERPNGKFALPSSSAVVNINEESDDDLGMVTVIKKEDDEDEGLTQSQKDAKLMNKGKIFYPTPKPEDRGSAKTSKRQKFTKDKKIKEEEVINDPLAPMLSSLIEDAKTTFQNLGSKFDKAIEPEEDNSMDALITALSAVDGLTPESQTALGMFFVDNPLQRRFFMKSNVQNRKIMAFMVLEDKLK